MKNLLTLLLLILAFQISFGQGKATLVDESGMITCDELKMRTWSFLEEIQKTPNSVGYAVIYEGKEDRKSQKWAEEIIFLSTYQLYQYGLPANNDILPKIKNLIKIVYGEKRVHFQFEFWKVPKDADKPKYTKESSLYSVPKLIKPFVFAISSNVANDGCPDFHPAIFADALKSNKNLKGEIVIFNLSKQLRKESIVYFEKLFQENKISRKHFKIFIINNPKKPSITEYWLVPKKKRN